MPDGIGDRCDAAIDADKTARQPTLQPMDAVVVERRNLAVFLGAEALQPSLAGMHPQGIGAGRKMPHWDETKGQFVPVTEAYLTLSFYHRVLDGGGAGRLLKRIADLLQEPEKL